MKKKQSLLERLRALPQVKIVSDERAYGGGLFTYLAPGWQWSEQTGFGTETVREAYSLAKQATHA